MSKPKEYTSIGKYERRNLLGTGGFGAVYEAFDRALEQPRAIKLIETDTPDELLEKLREARIQEICRHEHVVEVKEADIKKVDDKFVVVVVTELMKGGSAEKELLLGRISPKRACSLTLQSLLGLEHLHVNGVFHGDIKPGNILLTEYGKAKLSDFGLAVYLSSGDVIDMVYTLHTAPEYYPGMPATVSADVYAMGVTLYRLVNGIPDLRKEAGDITTVWQRIQEGKFPRRNGHRKHIPSRLKRIINKAMNVDVNSRYESALKFSEALNGLVWGIDWRRVGDLKWEGAESGKTHTLSAAKVTNKWRVEHIKNGRRVVRNCVDGLSTKSKAQAEMSELVKQTTLR
ncbi:serine/threonine-protein kinase [Planctomycetota bacterium]|nr:serine/threonine-protein kinase [Planctomycetota bacterium]